MFINRAAQQVTGRTNSLILWMRNKFSRRKLYSFRGNRSETSIFTSGTTTSQATASTTFTTSKHIVCVRVKVPSFGHRRR